MRNIHKKTSVFAFLTYANDHSNHITCKISFILFFFFLRFYSCIEKETERAQAGVGAVDSLLSREPCMRLDPWTLRTWPKLKADI